MEELHRQDAEKWLAMLREGVTNYDECVRYLHGTLARAQCTLADIESSPEEIKSLAPRNARKFAEVCLQALRAGFMRHYADTLITQMFRSCKVAGITPDNLGTDEAELGTFRATTH